MFIEMNEVRNRTAKIEDQGAGRFAVSKDTQRALLATYLNVAQSSLEAGMPPEALPPVIITYRKVTKAKARIEGVDYAALPGVFYDTHIGRAVIVRRNQRGEPFFTLKDANRDRGDQAGFTAIKLEGILSFAFAEPAVQRAFLARARGVA